MPTDSCTDWASRRRRRCIPLFPGVHHGHPLAAALGALVGFLGPRISEAFAQIKREMDPQQLLCPQRIVNPPKMDDTTLMRFAPTTLAPAMAAFPTPPQPMTAIESPRPMPPRSTVPSHRC